ncbi:MAG: spore germination protein [Oscillospiraceae bacterium]|nr:spore germination protein [Oscillospiraceae bacterium]
MKILRPKSRRARKDRSERPTGNGVEAAFRSCADFVSRELVTGGGARVRVFFLDGLVSGETIAREVIAPLTDQERFAGVPAEDVPERMLAGSVFASSAYRRETLEEVVSDLLMGCCALVFDDAGTAVTFEAKSQEKRSVDTPKEEKVVKGSKDAFTETLRTNTALIRRKLRTGDLKIVEFTAGSETHTRTALFYIDGYTNPSIVSEAARRLAGMEVEGVLTAAAVEECMADQPRTPFPQLLTTERPDKFCLNLLEGRVGVVADGLPIGFLAPGTFAQFLKVPEDSANHFVVGTAMTLLRCAALLLSLLLPAFFVAVAVYHQEMIPTKLLQSMIAAKQSVPFSAPMEVLLMLVSFELLQEAGLQLPTPVGATISIIGALIVGQSAVEARIVSPAVVIVVALAGVAGYTTPDQDMAAAMRLCRLLLVLAAIAAGMFGLVVGLTLLLYHLCTLESFGVPYMTPFVGAGPGELLRAFVRMPLREGSVRERALKTRTKG